MTHIRTTEAKPEQSHTSLHRAIDPRYGVPIRRFEMGACIGAANQLMLDAGFIIKCVGSYYQVRRPGERGRPRKITAKELSEMLDAERLKQGLEPIRKRP